jgi:hypothetical protein
VKVPFSYDTRDRYTPDTLDNTPGPEPQKGGKQYEPSSVWAEVKHPGMLLSDFQLRRRKHLRMTPVTDHGEAYDERDEGNGGDCKNSQQYGIK